MATVVVGFVVLLHSRMYGLNLVMSSCVLYSAFRLSNIVDGDFVFVCLCQKFAHIEDLNTGTKVVCFMLGDPGVNSSH